jgi:hypothetical protein
LTACPGPLVELQKSRRDAARKVIPKVTRWLKSQGSAPSILDRIGGSSFAVSAKRTTSREEPKRHDVFAATAPSTIAQTKETMGKGKEAIRAVRGAKGTGKETGLIGGRGPSSNARGLTQPANRCRGGPGKPD